MGDIKAKVNKSNKPNKSYMIYKIVERIVL